MGGRWVSRRALKPGTRTNRNRKSRPRDRKTRWKTAPRCGCALMRCDPGADTPSMSTSLSRRTWLKSTSAVLLAAPVSRAVAVEADGAQDVLRIDPSPTHELSPHLYMQFMEPLGTNDSSVEASWDHLNDRWRPELIEATRSLAPGMMRWGGLFCSYYRWREAVGPRTSRVPMYNIVWGGIESNQIGVAEFVDFCRQVGADPLMCVNFDSDGSPELSRA